MTKIIIFLISIFFTNAINASFGDTDHYFEVCLKLCHNKTKCSLAKKIEKKQSTYLKLFGRSCFDECKYECMWPTVDFYIDVWKFIVLMPGFGQLFFTPMILILLKKWTIIALSAWLCFNFMLFFFDY